MPHRHPAVSYSELGDAILNTARVAIVLLDLEGRVVDYNHFVEELSGRSAERARGLSWVDTFIPSRDRPRIHALLSRALRGDATRGNVNAILTKDGGERLIEWHDTTVPGRESGSRLLLAIGIDVTDRVRAETANRETMHMFRELAENMAEVVFVRDPERDQIVYANPAYERFWGHPRQRLYDDPRAFLERVHPEDRERVIAGLARQRLGNGYFDEAYRLVDDEGNIRWVRAHAFPLFDDDGRIYRVAGLVQDITTHKQLTQALERRVAERTKQLEAARTRLASILQAEPESVCLLDEDGVILEINPAGRSMLGASDEAQVEGQRAERFVAKEFRQAFRELNQRARDREPGVLEYVSVGLDGARRWLEARVVSLHEPTQGGMACLHVTRDVTERKQVEDALRSSRERLALATRAANAGIWDWDFEQQRHYHSERWKQLLGATDADLEGEPLGFFVGIVHPDDLRGVVPGMLEALAEGLPASGELRLRTGTGAYRWFHASAEIEVGASGLPKRLVGSMTDVEERRRAEEELRRSLEEKQVLLAEVHHRVKNNLQVVSSLLALQARRAESDTAKGLFEVSRDRINTMALIHEALYESPDLRVVGFSDYLRRLIAGLRSSYGELSDQVRLVDDVAGVRLGLTAAVPSALIVNELVTNAFKHAFVNRAKGEVRIGLRVVEGEHVLSVEDDGVSLPPEVDIDTAQSLGFSLVRALVKQLKGSLEVGTGRGTRVVVRFPAPASSD